ncbi:hypothetical protein AYJ54_18925 [Bradyrhizobium centrolobii]|uniref:DUF3024 domain-containing protein n=2 Tax=Bradyrhizobium TaxID=374 RepID=A0A176ZHF8_9BRAD|nr:MULTISPECIES: hypothetical protein [Bradyrhizobium]OAF06895.1 hypothetical protein AYJ54_18925 [Bradyrhizobium centrolobii]OAF19225.1 hypothetical protein AXW67_37850 [Bradyrhizobium neotropicale]
MTEAVHEPVRPAHPNHLDRRRIERTLDTREYYRYVSPRVTGVPGGYLIESPCCSRHIDMEGGLIDIALLRHDCRSASWQLFRKNHDNSLWELYSTHKCLKAAADFLSADPERAFWP